MHDEATDHLLRTFAALDPAEAVLVVGDVAAPEAALLARLGFRLATHRRAEPALPWPDACFGWVVLRLGAPPPLGLPAECRRVLRPGGWLFWTAPAEAAPALRPSEGLAEAEAPRLRRSPAAPVLQGILRRVEPGVPA